MWFKDRLKEETVKVSDDEFDRYARYLMRATKDFNKCNERLEIVERSVKSRAERKEDDALKKIAKDIDLMETSIDHLLETVMNDEEF